MKYVMAYHYNNKFLSFTGMVAAVGLSSLQFVDLNSSRNIFILGISLFFGLAFPVWIKAHSTYIDTGNSRYMSLYSCLF